MESWPSRNLGKHREAEAARDPVLRFPKLLIDEGVLDRRMLQDITHEIDEEVQQVTQQALRDAEPGAACDEDGGQL